MTARLSADGGNTWLQTAVLATATSATSAATTFSNLTSNTAYYVQITPKVLTFTGAPYAFSPSTLSTLRSASTTSSLVGMDRQ